MAGNWRCIRILAPWRVGGPVCMYRCGCGLSGVAPPCVSLNEDCSYLMVFLKFVQAVIPTVEYDYTKQLSLAT